MGCDYYITKDLIIEYKDSNGAELIKTIRIDCKPGYIHSYEDYDSEDDEDANYLKYKAEMARIIARNIYDKSVFEDNEWLKHSYKVNYVNYLKINRIMTEQINKIYIKSSALEIW